MSKIRLQRLQKTLEQLERQRFMDKNRKRERRKLGIEKGHYQKYIKPHLQEQYARQILNNSLKIGLIKKKPCAICGIKLVHAHHPDHKKPFEIIWLCPSHHKLIHPNKKSSRNQLN